MKFFYITCVLFLSASLVGAVEYSDFAVEVIDYQGEFGSSPYDDPCAVLGRPALMCKNGGPFAPSDPNFRVKLVESAYNVDANDRKVVIRIYPKEFSSDPNNYVVVKFDHKVVDYPGNLFGMDFIVFGNSFFEGIDADVNDNTNMNTYTLSGGLDTGKIRISVAQNADGPWYSFENGPYGDKMFPTQAYFWDRENIQWTDEKMNFTRPVDPNYTLDDFANQSAANAMDLYDGSGGGTGFDLQNLLDYNTLTIDPNSGYRWIQYVRLEGGNEEQGDIGGEIDAVSDVAACGDPTHPYPAGDINKDCRVDMIDFSILSGSWLECTYDCD